MLSPYIEIGEVLRPHGVQGLVRVRPDTGSPERYLSLSSVWIREAGSYREIPVEAVSVREDFVYLRLDGADTRDLAEKQRGWTLYVDRAHARPLQPDEWFICDLIGCRVRTDAEEELGEVTDVMQPGPNDVFVIRTPKGELLVPVLKDVIHSVDVAGRQIVLKRDRLAEVGIYQ